MRRLAVLLLLLLAGCAGPRHFVPGSSNLATGSTPGNPWQYTSTEYSKVDAGELTPVQVGGQALPPGLWEVSWSYYITSSTAGFLATGPTHYGVRLWILSEYAPSPQDASANPAVPQAQVWEDIIQGVAIVRGPATFWFEAGAEQHHSFTAVPFSAYFRMQYRNPTGVEPTPQVYRYTGYGVGSHTIASEQIKPVQLDPGPKNAQWLFNHIYGAFAWDGVESNGDVVTLQHTDNNSPDLEGAVVATWQRIRPTAHVGYFSYINRGLNSNEDPFELINQSALNQVTGYVLTFTME